MSLRRNFPTLPTLPKFPKFPKFPQLPSQKSSRVGFKPTRLLNLILNYEFCILNCVNNQRIIYTMPCAIIALATFIKPAMFAPFT